MRTGSRSVVLSLVFCAVAAAQCTSVPTTFSATCSQLQGYLDSFNSTIASQWNGSRPPVAFGAELTAADANRGLQTLLAPNTINSVELQLNGLVNLGVQSVVIGVSFPILYQPFYQYNNDPQDYAKVLTFYQNVMTEVRKRGLKVVIETSVLFPNHATDLPLTTYYATLSSAQITAGRAQTALVVAQMLQPDYLNLGSEPDTQSALLGLPAPYTPQQFVSEISTILSQLRGAGISGKPLIGAGVGTWSSNAAAFVQAEAATGLDFIDLHIYTANLGFLANAPSLFDMARAGGKRVALSEAWLRKLNDSQLQGKSDLGIESLLSSTTTTSLDNFSFWAALDTEFLNALVKMAYWKNLEYISPYPIQFLFAYLDYNSTIGQTPDQINAAETPLFTAALQQGIMSSTGQAYSAAIKSNTPVLTSGSLANGATYVPGGLVPGSWAQVKGSGLSGITRIWGNADFVGLGNNLPTNLSGVQVMVNNLPAAVYYIDSQQVSFQVPSGVSGNASVQVINNGIASNTLNATAAPSSPGIFPVIANGVNYPAGVFLDGTYVGDPANGSSFRKAKPGDVIQLYATGLEITPAAVLPVPQGVSGVTVNIGSISVPADFTGLVAVGEFQINFTVPAQLADGTYPISITLNGISSPARINSNPPGPIVLPVQR